MLLRRLLIVLLALSFLGAYACAADKPLIGNGDFESLEDGKPKGWGLKEGATLEEEDGNHFMRLTTTEPDKVVMVYRLVFLPPDVKALELKYKVRYENIKVGKENYFDGRIMMNFIDENKKKTSVKAPSFRGTKAQWETRTQQLKVPEGARQLEMMFTLFRASSGQLDFDDITLTPIDAAAVKEAPKMAPPVAAIIPPPPPEKLPKMLKVQGNQIVDSDGQPVWLQGVAIPSLEWSNTGDQIQKSVEVAINEWKVNCIRLPVKDDRWFGRAAGQNDGGAQYRQIIDNAINYSAARGVYFVIDLHRFRAPKESDAEFWRDVATKYKDHPAVLFELFNEPHDLPWDVWRDGGTVTDKKRNTDAQAENNEKLTTFETIGMQKLIDAVRETGAKNIVIVGGLDWSYDLSGILKGYACDDRGGNGIVYSTHVYPWKRKWQEKFLDVAEKYPLFLGEVGADAKKMDFMPHSIQEDAETWVPDMLGLIQKHKLHWTAWSFHPKASPRVLLDFENYTPTPFWGEHVKRALVGEQYEVKKLR